MPPQEHIHSTAPARFDFDLICLPPLDTPHCSPRSSSNNALPRPDPHRTALSRPGSAVPGLALGVASVFLLHGNEQALKQAHNHTSAPNSATPPCASWRCSLPPAQCRRLRARACCAAIQGKARVSQRATIMNEKAAAASPQRPRTRSNSGNSPALRAAARPLDAHATGLQVDSGSDENPSKKRPRRDSAESVENSTSKLPRRAPDLELADDSSGDESEAASGVPSTDGAGGDSEAGSNDSKPQPQADGQSAFPMWERPKRAAAQAAYEKIATQAKGGVFISERAEGETEGAMLESTDVVISTAPKQPEPSAAEIALKKHRAEVHANARAKAKALAEARRGSEASCATTKARAQYPEQSARTCPGGTQERSCGRLHPCPVPIRDQSVRRNGAFVRLACSLVRARCVAPRGNNHAR